MSTKPSVSSQNNDRRSINPATDSTTNLNTSGNINGSTYNSQKNSLSESRRPVNLDEDESQLNNYLSNQINQKMSNNDTNKRSINNNPEVNTARSHQTNANNNNQNFNSNSNNTFNSNSVRQNNTTTPKTQRTAVNTTPTRPPRQTQQKQKQERVVNQSPRRNESGHVQHHGAGTRIVKRELWWQEPDRESKVPFNQPFRLKDVTPRIDDKNPNYNPARQSTKIIDSRKLEWNAKSAVDTWTNFSHQPGGGNVRYPNMRVEWDVVS